jgi:hypothetical protein
MRRIRRDKKTRGVHTVAPIWRTASLQGHLADTAIRSDAGSQSEQAHAD